MKEENEKRKEKIMASISKEEIEEEMKITVEERVTPYYNLEYSE
jgi:hypothetical protein